MPKFAKPKSTDRRKSLANRINEVGEIMPRKCNNCSKNGRVCKVHISSGRCGACNERGLSSCDVRITEAEWKKLKSQRAVLLEEIERARVATSTALAKERRLLKQLELLDKRSSEAVASANREVEAENEWDRPDPVLDPSGPSEGDNFLNLLPGTWSAMDGLSDDFWVLAPGDTVVEASDSV